MGDLLVRLFVKDHENLEDSRVRTAIGSLSGAVGICCNLALCLGKLLAGLLSGSVSITADAHIKNATLGSDRYQMSMLVINSHPAVIQRLWMIVF